MAMTGTEFQVLPQELVTDPTAMTVVGLTRDTPVLLAAGADAAGVMTVSAITETWIETLWPLGTKRQKSTPKSADIVATEDGRALVLIPGQALLLLDPLAQDETHRTQRLKPKPSRMPDRLFAIDGGATGLWLRSDGKTLLATVDAQGVRDKSSERSGPKLKPWQTVNLILRDPAGNDTVVVEDLQTGFQIWRQESPGDWAHRVTDGAARHGLNARVVDGLVWGDRVVLATGSNTAVQQALLGMPLTGELITLEPDGQIQILAGELRISPTGLMVPHLSAAAIMAFNAEQFTHLAIDGAGHLIVAVVRRNGASGLFAIAPDMTVTALADPCHTTLGLVPDQTAPAGIRAVISH